MMIALVILAFGLLIVGAALPIGIDYTRRTAEKSVGEAATEYALDVIQSRIRLSENSLLDPNPPAPGAHLIKDNLFRPRVDAGSFYYQLLDHPNPNGPFFKVRPIPMGNIDAWGPDILAYLPDNTLAAGDVPGQLGVWMDLFWPSRTTSVNRRLELASLLPYGGTDPAGPTLSLAIPSVARVYPPIAPDQPHTPLVFYNAPYAREQISYPGGAPTPGSESAKARDRLIAWAAFYRRASYAPGSDPQLYEVIVVATRRPSTEHRFAQQNFTPGPNDFSQPFPYLINGLPRQPGTTSFDRVAPVPWLVTFTDVPFADDLGVYSPGAPSNPGRLLNGTAEPAELEFLCDPLVGTKLPEGSIFIPAVNDVLGGSGAGGWVGFAPHTPDMAPVYVVTQQIRDGNVYRIRVKNNGAYPWVDPTAVGSVIPNITTREQAWPVWIIPPARSGTSDGAQAFDTKSPILSWSSRYIRFPEVP